VLYEAKETLGGNLLPGGVPDFKRDDVALAKWYENELSRLNVEVKTGTIADETTIEQETADVVIFAGGALPKKLNLREDDRICFASEVLLGEVPKGGRDAAEAKENIPGKRIAVAGGGLVGCETALWLVKQGFDVTIIEAEDALLKINAPTCHANHEMLEKLIHFNGENVMTGSRVERMTDQGVWISGPDGEKELEIDQLILAVGYEPDKNRSDKIRKQAIEFYEIGDANRVSNIMYAIWDAFELARTL
jgi:2-enoate reductase